MKPVVRYSDLGSCQVGEQARLIPVDHPDSFLNGQWIRTTLVRRIMRYGTGPVFETKNTIYWPAETDESDLRFIRKAEKV